MSSASPQTAVLPALRPDIEFHRGPDDWDGSPTYVIHDPLRGTFDKLTWIQAEILRRLRVPVTLAGLLRQLGQRTTVRVSGEDVVGLCNDAARRGLTMDSRVADMRAWEAQRTRPRPGGLTRLFRGAIFMRIPLIHPDAFLARTVGVVRHLGSRAALAVYLLLGLAGVCLLAQRLDAYLATFPYFFNWRGALCFGLTVAVVKTIHEFSHAYVAKARGIRVPTMGVALIFLFPVAFADVTDSWRMRSRKKRLLIGLAGVIAELVIAGVALCVWALSGPGLLGSACFVVSSVTLLSTLLINLNPAMRYDGYYVLSDLLGIDNLQSRSFAVARWVVRRHVLGMDIAAPEVGLPPRRLALMLAYAGGAWTYRFFLYVGISLMLYHRLTKVVGAALFVVAVYSFLIKPVASEVINIMKLRRMLSWNPRTIATALLCGGLLFWLAYPLPRRQAVPAATVAHESQVIYSPGDGVLSELAVGLNSRVTRGQTLFVLRSEELEAQAEWARLEVERVGIELGIVKSEGGDRALLPRKAEELTRAEARLESVRTAIERNRFVAEVDGIVVEWDESLRPGLTIGADQVLGRIVEPRGPTVVCYVRDDLAADVGVGSPVTFRADADPRPCPGVVTFVDTTRAAHLEQRGLASTVGGEIAVKPDAHGRLEVVDCYYQAEVRLERPRPPPRIGQTGHVWLRTAPRSRLGDLLRRGYSVLLRESSF